MKLEEIGFYTLEESRALNVLGTSPLWRGELLLTDKCNFKCLYCRGVRLGFEGEMPFEEAQRIVYLWAMEGLKNIRFSGGEPTLYKGLLDLVKVSKGLGIQRIAVSTNGSASLDLYRKLFEAGVNDFSISLDACCSSFGDKMAGIEGKWAKVVENIQEISKWTYVTVGMVFTPENLSQAKESVEFASSLGVSDIRIISSAQYNGALDQLVQIDEKILNKHPILKYRINNYKQGRNVRGMSTADCGRCYIVLDDLAVLAGYHFPCIIWLREGGEPIGRMDTNFRQQRLDWFSKHDVKKEPICSKNCLDICIQYNNCADCYAKNK
jgi:molybdenum cofactor biosynthesis enzyme MoaA